MPAETDTVTEHVDLTDDPGFAMQTAAERHLNAVWEAHYAQEEAEDEQEEIPSPAVGPFCGCETCIVREVIAGAWPVIEAYFTSRNSCACG
jgi:hypothetical protein